MRRWNCPNSEDLDRFFLDPGFERHNEINDHLSECQHCSLYISRRKKEFTEIEETWMRGSLPGVIHLREHGEPEQIEGAGNNLPAGRGEKILALAESLILVSENMEILIRAMRDQSTGDVCLILVSEIPEIYKNILVRPFNLMREYISDDEGRINLGKIEWPSKEDLVAEISLPKASFTLNPHENSADKSEDFDLTSSNGDLIKVRLQKTGGNYRIAINTREIKEVQNKESLKVAVRENGRSRTQIIGKISDGTVSIDNINIENGIEIFLYH